MNNEDKAWTDYRNKFADIYDDSNYESPLQSFVMNRSHKMIEKKFNGDVNFSKVLEVGAGTGEHIKHIRHRFDQYIISDMDAKTLDIARVKNKDIYQGKIKYEIQNGDKLSYADNSFDRVIASHVLEHIYHPHLALKEWQRVLKDGGILSILIPTDPGLAWRLGRHLGPRRNALAMGIDYDYIMAREHVNSCNNLIAFIRHYFPDRTESWWPFPIASIDLNLFFVSHITINKTEIKI